MLFQYITVSVETVYVTVFSETVFWASKINRWTLQPYYYKKKTVADECELKNKDGY